tara:strand:+ start:429 stop:641 length:213 start_codon:yes stop_codon:yes gene_type:complete
MRKVLVLVKANRPFVQRHMPVISPPEASGKITSPLLNVPHAPGCENMILPSSDRRFPIKSRPKALRHKRN